MAREKLLKLADILGAPSLDEVYERLRDAQAIFRFVSLRSGIKT